MYNKHMQHESYYEYNNKDLTYSAEVYTTKEEIIEFDKKRIVELLDKHLEDVKFKLYDREKDWYSIIKERLEAKIEEIYPYEEGNTINASPFALKYAYNNVILNSVFEGNVDFMVGLYVDYLLRNEIIKEEEKEERYQKEREEFMEYLKQDEYYLYHEVYKNLKEFINNKIQEVTNKGEVVNE